jgi:adenine nucleotide transporter 17
MSNNNKRSLLSYETLVHAIAGSVGSVTAMTTFYPLDTVRSRLQLEEHRVAKSTIQTLLDLINEEGFSTLYRGLKPPLQSLCVSNFVYFYTFHALKRLRPSTESSAVKDLLFGSVAGVINVLTTTPLWVVNTRVKMQGIGGRESQEDDFKGLLDGLYKIYKTNGILALWAGTLPSLMLVINPAIQFMTYESIKRRLAGRKLGSLSYFMIAAVAKTVATVLTYPLQLIQTRMRHGGGGRNAGVKSLRKDLANQDNRFTKVLMNILKTHGVKGLFKGMESKILQTVLTSALMFVIYEKIHRWVRSVMLAGRALPKN